MLANLAMTSTHLALAPAFLALVSCVAPSGTAYDFEVKTERMVVRGKGQNVEGLCGGTGQWIDRYVDALAPYYGVPDGVIGDYVWFSQEQFDESEICGSSESCQGWTGDDPVVFAPHIPIEHEIVHVLQKHVSPNSCVAMIEEGLAEFLRGPRGTGTPSAMDDLLDASFAGDNLTTGEYARARNFVSFLVHGYGLRTVIDLCAAVPKGSSWADFDEASLDLMGKSLEQLLDDYDTYPECHETRDRAKILECSRAPVASVGKGETVAIEIEASCSSPVAVGPKWGAFHISQQVRILDEGYYSVSFTSPTTVPDVALRFERCASCAEDPDFISVGSYVTWLLPGDYALDLAFPLETSTDLTVLVEGS